MYLTPFRPSRPLSILLLILSLALLPAAAAQAVDYDYDGLDDGLEWTLSVRHAPVIYLHPSEWNLPANVEWFLDRARMRFHHSCSALALCCGDHGIFDYGGATQSTLISQVHSKRGWSLLKGCHHTNPQSSGGDWDDDHHFFLQLQDADHSGAWYTGDWKVYTHVYPNTLGGINVQYWFFYAYNDGPSGFNHEGDWESLLVELDAYQNVNKVYTARHNDPYSDHAFAPGSITWYGGTHPVVLSALGTHATYESYSSCSSATIEHGCAWGDPSWRWFTWSGGRPAGDAGYQGGGLVHVGEKGYPLNGQRFVKYSGRWGEIGSTAWTNGPRGPAYQSKWNYGRASSGGGGGGGGDGGCETEETSPTDILEPC